MTLIVTLPAGLGVDTVAGSNGIITDTSLAAGAALSSNASLSGTWTAASRQAKLVVVHAPSSTWSGEYARLKVTVASGTQVTEADIQALNTSPGAYKVVAFDTTAHSTVVVTSLAPTSLRVVN